MPVFMNDQINVIGKKKSGAVEGCIQKKEGVDAKPGYPGKARNRFPIAELRLKQRHAVRVTSSAYERSGFVQSCFLTSSVINRRHRRRSARYFCRWNRL